MNNKPAIEMTIRPRTRQAFMTAVLIVQSGLLLGSVLLVDSWVQTNVTISQIQTDRLFILQLSIAMSVLILTAVVFYLVSRRYKDSLEQSNQNLQNEVRRQVSDGLAKRNALIHGLAKLADYRDTDTGDHLERIGHFARVLADHLAPNHPIINSRWIDRLVLASSLHDIGKVGIPDAILLKPGKLTENERTIMEKHTLIGAETLLSIRSKLGPDEFIDMGIEIALQHHEKWDGSGYPFCISGKDISLTARIVALADVYDALTSERVYKKAFSHCVASDIITEGKGTHFDPEIVEAFQDNSAIFDAIRATAHTKQPHQLQFPDIESAARSFIDEYADNNSDRNAA